MATIRGVGKRLDAHPYLAYVRTTTRNDIDYIFRTVDATETPSCFSCFFLDAVQQ